MSLATDRTPRMLTLAEAPAPEEFLFTCTPADLPESDRVTVSVRGNFTFARNKVIDDGKYYAYPWQDQRGVRYGLTMRVRVSAR